MKKPLNFILLLLICFIACSKNNTVNAPVQTPTVGQTKEKPVLAIEAFCRPYAVSARQTEAEIPVFASATFVSTQWRIPLQASNLNFRMVSGPNNARIKEIVNTSPYATVRLSDLVVGEYKIEIVANFEGSRAIDTVPLSVVPDTLAGKTFYLEGAWSFASQDEVGELQLGIRRPDLFFTSGNRKFEVEIKLENTGTWIRVPELAGPGDDFQYTLLPCQRSLYLLPGPNNRTQPLTGKSVLRVTFL